MALLADLNGMRQAALFGILGRGAGEGVISAGNRSKYGYIYRFKLKNVNGDGALSMPEQIGMNREGRKRRGRP